MRRDDRARRRRPDGPDRSGRARARALGLGSLRGRDRRPRPAGRRFRAHPEDADGRAARKDVELSWTLQGPGSLATDGFRAVYRAPEEDGEARIVARARQGESEASAEAEVAVLESVAARERTSGIPEPRPVNAPSEPWRSRLLADAWEYNEGHRDYLAVAGEDARRLRYLKHLFVKEVVLRNFGAPADDELLERMVEVLTYLGDGRGR